MRRTHFLGALTGLTALAAGPVGAALLPPARITLGDEVLIAERWRDLKGARVGVIANQSSVTSRLISVVDALRASGRVRVSAIYAPEHGFRGDRTAGASVTSYTDPQTGLPVYSLYGATRHPNAAMLAGIDALLFDIQDVGARAYTFVSTMAEAMRSAKAHGKAFWVLDRPNPVGGAIVEGPVLDPQFESFIGLFPIPMRHGMTIGELARLFNDHFGIGADLHVVPMRGYTRTMLWPQTGLHWVQTSPNIPTWQTCFVYLCTGLIDNAGINNGADFSNPFFLAGTQGLDGELLAARLNARNLPGVYFRPAAWSPFAGFWKGRELSGVELVLVDLGRFLPVHTAVALLTTIRDIAPHAIHVKRRGLDYDWGTSSLAAGLLAGKSAEEIIAQWVAGLERFAPIRAKYLLYGTTA